MADKNMPPVIIVKQMEIISVSIADTPAFGQSVQCSWCHWQSLGISPWSWP